MTNSAFVTLTDGHDITYRLLASISRGNIIGKGDFVGQKHGCTTCAAPDVEESHKIRSSRYAVETNTGESL